MKRGCAKLVARCGICDRRRSLTCFVVATGRNEFRRICGGCWADRLVESARAGVEAGEGG